MAGYLDLADLPPADESDSGSETSELDIDLLEQQEPFLEYTRAWLDRAASPPVAFFEYSYCRTRPLRVSLHFHDEPTTDADLDAALFHLGLVVLPWFWMGFVCRRVVVSAGFLDAAQLAWWGHFYRECLAEFAVVNHLKPTQVALKLVCTAPEPSAAAAAAPATAPAPTELPTRRRVLCPLGGGKDSLVAFQMLREQGHDPRWLYVADGVHEFRNSSRLQEIVRRSGAEDVLLLAFDFAYLEFAKVRSGMFVPCGHPWAACVGWSAVVASLAFGPFDGIAVGNERSANFGNGIFLGEDEVNHQFDKALAFERRLHEYVRQHVAPHLHYFSALQRLWEVQIAWFFARRCQAFHSVFISCNESEGLTRWCGRCDKCAFVCALLSAWLPASEVAAVFDGHDLLDDEALLPAFLRLADNGAAEDGAEAKPFECVGTPHEATLSLWLARQRRLAEGAPLPLVLRCCPTLDDGPQLLHLLTDLSDDHLLPPWWGWPDQDPDDPACMWRPAEAEARGLLLLSPQQQGGEEAEGGA